MSPQDRLVLTPNLSQVSLSSSTSFSDISQSISDNFLRTYIFVVAISVNVVLIPNIPKPILVMKARSPKVRYI